MLYSVQNRIKVYVSDKLFYGIIDDRYSTVIVKKRRVV